MGQALNAEAHPDDVPDEPGIEPSYLIESAIIFVFGGPPRWALGAMELRGAIAGRAALATDIVVVEVDFFLVSLVKKCPLTCQENI